MLNTTASLQEKMLKLLLSLSLLVLNNCMGGWHSHPPTKEQTWSENGHYFLSLANHTPDAQAQTPHLLAASQAFLKAGQHQAARSALDRIETQALDNTQQIDYTLTRAALLAQSGQSSQALSLLNTIKTTLNPDEAQRFFTIKMQAYQEKQNTFESLKARANLLNRLNDPQAQRDNAKVIWQTLQALPLASLMQAANQNSNALSPWLQLCLITKTQLNSATDFLNSLRNWQSIYSNHIANQLLLPDNLDKLQAQFNTPVQRVALLLPLTGEFAAEGNAIKNSFMTLYYRNRATHPLNITVCDTEKQSVQTCYENAIAAGAQTLIGPLRKPQIESFVSNITPSIPTLLLNTPSHLRGSDAPLYYFGLSPLDELQTLAKQLRINAQTHSLLIYPDNDWAADLAEKFKTFYAEEGGEVIEELAFDPKRFNTYAEKIESLLQIDRSENRHNQLEKLTGEKIPFTPQIRKDIDAILLIASPEQARQIRPLLKFYYAGRLPTYALSTLYTGEAKAQLDRDLDGIILPEIPWILTPNAFDDPLRKELISLWGNDYTQHIRLYALGIDSYHLMIDNRRLLLPLFNELGLPYASGLLHTSGNRIVRYLPLGTFMKGDIKPL